MGVGVCVCGCRCWGAMLFLGAASLADRCKCWFPVLCTGTCTCLILGFCICAIGLMFCCVRAGITT